VLPPDRLTVIVNVGDDEEIYGLHVSPDLDTVLYTLSGREGPQGWGVAGDTFDMMSRLAELGIDTTFRLGDQDLVTNVFRTLALESGSPLTGIVRKLADSMGVALRILPVTDDPVRTRIRTTEGEWLSFQEYFVIRGHRDEVAAVAYAGADEAAPAPGVLEAIAGADLVVVAPSNPPLSVWPILAVPGVRHAVAGAKTVVVSPLFGGKALKGPADRVMRSLGLPPGNAGVLAAYDGLVDRLVIDRGDAGEADGLAGSGVAVSVLDTRIAAPAAAASFAEKLLETTS
jgi:LPPG:FO 2-phospho-L-lactate transferase